MNGWVRLDVLRIRRLGLVDGRDVELHGDKTSGFLEARLVEEGGVEGPVGKGGVVEGEKVTTTNISVISATISL